MPPLRVSAESSMETQLLSPTKGLAVRAPVNQGAAKAHPFGSKKRAHLWAIPTLLLSVSFFNLCPQEKSQQRLCWTGRPNPSTSSLSGQWMEAWGTIRRQALLW